MSNIFHKFFLIKSSSATFRDDPVDQTEKKPKLKTIVRDMPTLSRKFSSAKRQLNGFGEWEEANSYHRQWQKI